MTHDRSEGSKTADAHAPENRDERRAEYSPPRLVTYGSVGDITRAVGNTSNMDGGAVNGMKKSQP